MQTHSRVHSGRGRTPRPRARQLRKGGLLRGLPWQVRRGSPGAAVAIATTDWLGGGNNERHERGRARRVRRAQASGAGRAFNGEASHG